MLRGGLRPRLTSAERRHISDRRSVCHSNACGNFGLHERPAGCFEGCGLLKKPCSIELLRLRKDWTGPSGRKCWEPMGAEPDRVQWAAGVTTAPRKTPTLDTCLRSIERAGWVNIRIFADGECSVPEGYDVTRRTPAAGAFSNWWLSLQELVSRSPNAKWYALFQDDVILCQGVRERVEQLDPKGMLSLYQSFHHPNQKMEEFQEGKKFVGALALVIPQSVAHKMVSSSFGLAHRLMKNRQNDYIDGGVGQWCQENKIPLLIHGPSLAQHIGETSTLGHREPASATFVGEQFDAKSLTSAKKIGLIGFNTAQGLGYLNRDVAKNLPLHRWLVIEHRSFPTLPMIPGVNAEMYPHDANDAEMREWLDGLDVVLFAECIPQNIPKVAQSMGIKVVCIPMVEWLPAHQEWTKHVDLWLAPTLFSYNQLLMKDMKGKVEYCPWPIDTRDYTYRQRTKCERFVFAHGNGGPRDRKGGHLMAAAAKLAPEIPLIVYSQVQDGIRSSLTEEVQWPSTVEFRGSAPTPAELYHDGDVFILPSRWEGLGLQLLECQAAGMPLVTTDAPPMNETNPWRRLPCHPRRVHLSHDYPSFDVAPKTIAQMMRDSLGADISEASRRAREWVVTHRDWGRQMNTIRALILGA